MQYLTGVVAVADETLTITPAIFMHRTIKSIFRIYIHIIMCVCTTSEQRWLAQKLYMYAYRVYICMHMNAYYVHTLFHHLQVKHVAYMFCRNNPNSTYHILQIYGAINSLKTMNIS